MQSFLWKRLSNRTLCCQSNAEKKADMVPCSFLRYPTEYAPLVGTGMNLGERRVSINKIFWERNMDQNSYQTCSLLTVFFTKSSRIWFVLVLPEGLTCPLKVGGVLLYQW